MSRKISLAHLTTLDLPPPQMIRVAAEIGYDAVGLRLIAVTPTTASYPLMQDAAMLRETRAALADTGLFVNDIEFLRMTADFAPQDYEAFLDVGAALGARHVICAPYDPDMARLAANLAGFNALCAPRGIRPVLEFFPWTNVADLLTACRIVEATGEGAIGILVDALHFNRSNSSLAELAQQVLRHPQRFPFLHLCDAPVQPSYSTEELFHAGRAERLPPGLGQIDLAAILDRMPRTTAVALEVPMTAQQSESGSAHVARQVYAAAVKLLAGRSAA
jgi:sugar phosphate isomerase/epimerase